MNAYDLTFDDGMTDAQKAEALETAHKMALPPGKYIVRRSLIPQLGVMGYSYHRPVCS
jgi:hypothetical protein